MSSDCHAGETLRALKSWHRPRHRDSPQDLRVNAMQQSISASSLYSQYVQQSGFCVEESSDSKFIELYAASMQDAAVLTQIVLRAKDFIYVSLNESELICSKRGAAGKNADGFKIQLTANQVNTTTITISWSRIESGSLASQLDQRQKSMVASKLLELIQVSWSGKADMNSRLTIPCQMRQ